GHVFFAGLCHTGTHVLLCLASSRTAAANRSVRPEVVKNNGFSAAASPFLTTHPDDTSGTCVLL
ncbi:MAG TPA: hypothetical protein VFQ19_14735, partial [Nocardioidaceae bacterium]|nr:hypothetical protein [Nocardioidaceae bacterium]